MLEGARLAIDVVTAALEVERVDAAARNPDHRRAARDDPIRGGDEIAVRLHVPIAGAGVRASHNGRTERHHVGHRKALLLQRPHEILLLHATEAMPDEDEIRARRHGVWRARGAQNRFRVAVRGDRWRNVAGRTSPGARGVFRIAARDLREPVFQGRLIRDALSNDHEGPPAPAESPTRQPDHFIRGDRQAGTRIAFVDQQGEMAQIANLAASSLGWRPALMRLRPGADRHDAQKPEREDADDVRETVDRFHPGSRQG